jgi:hypothetical protein
MQPTHEEIAVAAYYIWLKQVEDSDGSPEVFSEANAVANWLEAERILDLEAEHQGSDS